MHDAFGDAEAFFFDQTKEKLCLHIPITHPLPPFSRAYGFCLLALMPWKMAGPGPGPAGEPMDTSDEIQWCFSQIKGTVDSEEISEGKRQ